MSATTNQGYLGIEDLETGGVYRLKSRNLDIGVFDGNQGFIGIREKFNHRYLDTEYLFHTAWATQLVGHIDSGIEITESRRRCRECGELVKCSALEAGQEWREAHVDAEGNPIGAANEHEIYSVYAVNTALFTALEALEGAATLPSTD